MELPKYELVDNEGAWNACLDTIGRAPRLAVDLEANSLHAYREKVCLIQISVPEHDFIIDPLAGLDLEPLGGFFADSGVEKIFHASDYDLVLLKSLYGWRVANLFDTMWAARILGYTKMGLATFLEEFFGVHHAKRHQKADWAVRPLPEPWLEYAQRDTHYLLALRDLLAQRIEEGGQTEEAWEIFANACHATEMDRAFDPDGFWSIRGARQLSPKALAILRELCIFRDKEAQRRDVPVFKVLSNDVLIRIAAAGPKTEKALLRVEGLSKRLAERLGAKLLRAVEQGRAAKPPVPPKHPPRGEPGVSDRYKALHAWRRETAQRRGVESDVIMTRNTMWHIAEVNPKVLEDLDEVSSLGPHRLALYGQEVLRELLSVS